MPARTRYGYEALLLMLLVVAIVMSAFISAVHFGHIDIWTNIRELYTMLAHPRNN